MVFRYLALVRSNCTLRMYVQKLFKHKYHRKIAFFDEHKDSKVVCPYKITVVAIEEELTPKTFWSKHLALLCEEAFMHTLSF